MKKLIPLILCLAILLCLPACTYSPPEGYTKEHHTYEEILEFARSLDPNAVVSEEYTDTTIEEGNRKFREYPAVIHGIECHVSSVGDMVWNDGFLAGEFARQYFVIDTDYDYLLLKQILSEKQPHWSMRYDDISSRYNWNDVVSVLISANHPEQLTDPELEIIWQQAKEIYEIYQTSPVRKTIYFTLPAPRKYYNHHGEGEYFINRNANVIFDSFSENDKTAFFSKYHESWALLESGLPVYD